MTAALRRPRASATASLVFTQKIIPPSPIFLLTLPTKFGPFSPDFEVKLISNICYFFFCLFESSGTLFLPKCKALGFICICIIILTNSIISAITQNNQ
jgi:hypothetical protein